MLLRESTDEYRNKSSNKNFLNLQEKILIIKNLHLLRCIHFGAVTMIDFYLQKILNKSNFKFSITRFITKFSGNFK